MCLVRQQFDTNKHFIKGTQYRKWCQKQEYQNKIRFAAADRIVPTVMGVRHVPHLKEKMIYLVTSQAKDY